MRFASAVPYFYEQVDIVILRSDCRHASVLESMPFTVRQEKETFARICSYFFFLFETWALFHGGYKVHGAPVAVLRRKRVSGRIFHLAGVVQDRVVLSKRPCPILYDC